MSKHTKPNSIISPHDLKYMLLYFKYDIILYTFGLFVVNTGYDIRIPAPLPIAVAYYEFSSTQKLILIAKYLAL